MTKQEASVRNHNIMRLRGILPHITSIVPNDIASNFKGLDELQKLANELIIVIKITVEHNGKRYTQ